MPNFAGGESVKGKEQTMDKIVKTVAGVNKQPHRVVHISPHPAQQRKDMEQAAQHNRDMERMEKLHRRGEK